MTMDDVMKGMYVRGIENLRGLLQKIGRHEFRAFGYTAQLREYRAIVRQA
jgi:hypothetical protein